MTLQLSCPTCDGEIVPDHEDLPQIPDPGAVAVCDGCVGLWVFAEHVGWSAPTPEQRTTLLADTVVVERLTLSQFLAEQRVADKEAIITLVAQAGACGEDLGQLADRILAAGFHRCVGEG